MRHELCPACHGDGQPDEDGYGRCPRCKGIGYVVNWLDYADHLAAPGRASESDHGTDPRGTESG